MMQKWFGSLLVFVACSGIGFCRGQEMKWHLKELEQIRQLFCLLRSELQYTRAPFAEIFERIGRKTEGKYGEWLLRLSQRLKEKGTGMFWQVWCVSLEKDLHDSHLLQKEIEELKEAGKNLSQIESLDLYVEQLEYSIRNERDAYPSKRKLCQSMGIMGGIFFIILLM